MPIVSLAYSTQKNVSTLVVFDAHVAVTLTVTCFAEFAGEPPPAATTVFAFTFPPPPPQEVIARDPANR